MPSQPRNMAEQEHSIKVRSNELYVDDSPVAPEQVTKPFPVYLRETPARPLSGGIKAIFWTLGIIVALLFVAALWRVAHHQVPKRPAGKAGVQAVGMHGPGHGRGELADLFRVGSPAVIRRGWTQQAGNRRIECLS
jgi:hypothetical protein